MLGSKAGERRHFGNGGLHSTRHGALALVPRVSRLSHVGCAYVLISGTAQVRHADLENYDGVSAGKYTIGLGQVPVSLHTTSFILLKCLTATRPIHTNFDAEVDGLPWGPGGCCQHEPDCPPQLARKVFDTAHPDWQVGNTPTCSSGCICNSAAC